MIVKLFNYFLQKHNKKIYLKCGLVYCARCKRLILKTDKYCQYCGVSMRKEVKRK